MQNADSGLRMPWKLSGATWEHPNTTLEQLKQDQHANTYVVTPLLRRKSHAHTITDAVTSAIRSIESCTDGHGGQ